MLRGSTGVPSSDANTSPLSRHWSPAVSRSPGLDADKPSTVAAAAKKAGLEVIDTATAEALRHDAAEGRKMAAAAAQQRIEASVEDAVRKGKITPARRKHWVTLITADPGMAEVLASVPNETAAPMTEAGHSMNPDPGDNLADVDAWVI